MFNISKLPGSIDIGYVGETNFRTIEIDMTPWMESNPDGVPSIVCIRPKEKKADAYVAATTFENNVLRWTITAGDIGSHEGTGEIQIWLEEEENETVNKRGKSVKVKTIVHDSASDPAGEVPAAQQAVLEQMTQLKNETVSAAEDAEDAKDAAEQAAADAEAAVVHQPYIDSTSKHWMVWDSTEGEYTDTEITAEGQPGQPGDPTQLIDDTAGEGATGKTWSANKLDETTGLLLNAIQGLEATEHGKNLFNGTRTDGAFVNPNNGTLNDNDSYAHTDYIEITSNTTYTISGWSNGNPNVNGLMYALYTSDKTYVSGASSTQTFTAGETVKYIRFSMLKSINPWQLEVGSTATDYEAYKEVTILNPVMVWSEKTKQNVLDLIDDTPMNVTPKDTTFFKPSPNLFDPSTEVENELVNQASGAFQSNTGSNRSGYIEIKPNTPYSFINEGGGTNQYIRYAFYKSNKTFISGAYALIKDLGFVKSPSNAKYIAISFPSANRPFMVAESDTIPAFYPYSYTCIDPQYVVSELPNDIIINLPTKVYATEGIELNIYFENLTEDWTKYKWNVDCTVGQQMERGYTLTPTSSQAGTYELSITAKAQDGTEKRVNASLIVTAVSAGTSDSVSVLILGDSTTANGTAVTKLNANFADDPMTVSTVGTLGTAPNNHEGRSGWTFNQYFNESTGNAFYHNSTFDAPYYFQNSGISAPDWFFINLGINDMFNYTTDTALMTAIDTVLGLCDDMIESVKTASAGIKIGVCLTIPPNHSQDAFGKAYNCNQSRDRYKRNNAIWVRKLIEKYDRKESSGIYVIPIHTALDTVYNMGMESLPVNARNTSVTYDSPIGNGGVHPVESGYWQIADVYTAFLKAQAE